MKNETTAWRAVLFGGPLHRERRVVPAGQRHIDAPFLEPQTAAAVLNDDAVATLETPMYVCRYEVQKVSPWGDAKFEFVSMSPSASTRLREEIRREERAKLRDEIASWKAKYDDVMDTLREMTGGAE